VSKVNANETALTYRDAGVDIDAGDSLVERIKPHVKRTMRPEVMTDLGGFAGLCALPSGYREPLLVSCTDGVGTKLKLAFLTGKHGSVGVDLVAMSVNDLICCGAEPLLFLDYFASGKLEVAVAEQVIAGIADGCQQARCALVGGETAELPGFYAAGEYDLAGFCVGVVEKSARVDGRAIVAGDRLLGLASSGFHSNGYSLVRRVLLEHMGLPLDRPAEGLQPAGGLRPAEGPEEPLADVLLRPTRIYVRAMRALYAQGLLRGAAHITGGGLVDNPTRMLPGGAKLKLRLTLGSWEIPPIMKLLQRGGNVADAEMLRTFNMGLGMLACVPASRVAEARRLLEAEGERVFDVGEVAAADDVDAPVEFVT
jgi:phosphoribosylformylglycinamidine cyclo-ligase